VACVGKGDSLAALPTASVEAAVCPEQIVVRPFRVVLPPPQMSMLSHLQARRLASAARAARTDRHARGRGGRGRLEKSLK